MQKLIHFSLKMKDLNKIESIDRYFFNTVNFKNEKYWKNLEE